MKTIISFILFTGSLFTQAQTSAGRLLLDCKSNTTPSHVIQIYANNKIVYQYVRPTTDSLGNPIESTSWDNDLEGAYVPPTKPGAKTTYRGTFGSDITFTFTTTVEKTNSEKLTGNLNIPKPVGVKNVKLNCTKK